MKIIIGHLMCSLLFKMMMLIVHACCRLLTVVWDPGRGLTCTWRVRWGCSRIKLLKETNLGVNLCSPLPLHLNRQQARESVRGVNKGW